MLNMLRIQSKKNSHASFDSVNSRTNLQKHPANNINLDLQYVTNNNLNLNNFSPDHQSSLFKTGSPESSDKEKDQMKV